jgi:hypothetical protein
MPGDLAGRRGGAASCRPGRNTDLLRTLLRVLTPKPHTALGMYNCNRSIRLRRPVPRCIASCKPGSAGRRSEPVRGRQQGSFRSLVWSKLRCAPEPPFAAMMAGAEIVLEIGIGNRQTRLGRYLACRERPELRAPHTAMPCRTRTSVEGQTAKNSARAHILRSATEPGRCSMQPARRKSANKRLVRAAKRHSITSSADADCASSFNAHNFVTAHHSLNTQT